VLGQRGRARSCAQFQLTASIHSRAPQAHERENKAQGCFGNRHQGLIDLLAPYAKAARSPVWACWLGKTVLIQELDSTTCAKEHGRASRFGGVGDAHPPKATTFRRVQGIRSDQLRGSPVKKWRFASPDERPPGARMRWAFAAHHGGALRDVKQPGCSCSSSIIIFASARPSRIRNERPVWVAWRPPWVISPPLPTGRRASSKSAITHRLQSSIHNRIQACVMCACRRS